MIFTMTNISCLENRTGILYEESRYCSCLSQECSHLFQAFVSVEKGYFDSIDDVLAEKANLQLQIPEVILISLYYLCFMAVPLHYTTGTCTHLRQTFI